VDLTQFIRFLDQEKIIEITLRPPKKKYIFPMLFSLMFVGIGFWMIFSKDSSFETVSILFFQISLKTLGWIEVAIFGSAFCLFLFAIGSDRTLGLTLNSQGFYTTTLFKTSRCFEWKEIEFFIPGSLGRLKTVFFSYVSQHPEKGKILTRITQGMSYDQKTGLTVDACLPDTYGLKSDVLCDLLNRCLLISRGNFSSQQTPTLH